MGQGKKKTTILHQLAWVFTSTSSNDYSFENKTLLSVKTLELPVSAAAVCLDSGLSVKDQQLGNKQDYISSLCGI